MAKKIWNALGDIRLTFWLLMAGAAIFLIGVAYTLMDFAYFKAMNEVRIQDWIIRELPSRPGANWWIPVLLAILFLLGINTAICSTNRVIEILKGRKQINHRFILSLLPSAVHCLFLVVLAGHVATVTAGSWNRLLLVEGAEIIINDSMPPMTVKAIDDSFFPVDSLLKKRISQTEVTLSPGNGEDIHLSYLDSIRHSGYRLHLDMVKERYPERQKIRHTGSVDKDETCNRSETYLTREGKREKTQALHLLVISDPGLPVILTAFTLILVLMSWYFIGTTVTKNGSGENPASSARGE